MIDARRSRRRSRRRPRSATKGDALHRSHREPRRIADRHAELVAIGNSPCPEAAPTKFAIGRHLVRRHIGLDIAEPLDAERHLVIGRAPVEHARRRRPVDIERGGDQ